MLSKFLGFIHYTMFDKIKFQESIVQEVFGLAKEKGYGNLVENTNKIGVLESGELEEIIDGDNIHGWLQERVELVEKRFAYIVTSLANEDEYLVEEISSALYELGEKENPPRTVKEGYELINSKFLDGMPCDRAIMILEESEDSALLKINIDKHSEFWTEHSMEDLYWKLRNEYIKGMFDKSEYNYRKVEEHLYKIGR